MSEPDVIVVVHEPDPAVLRDDMAETWGEIIDEACEPQAVDCINCGQCEACIDRAIVAAEESGGEA